MENLLSWSFWFNLRPPAMLPLFNYLFIAILIIFLILAIVAVIIKNRHKLYRSFWKKFYSFSAINLMIGLLLFFFSYQRAPFLSARFWLAIWGISAIIWLIFLLLEIKKIPLKRQQLEKDQAFRKYLP